MIERVLEGTWEEINAHAEELAGRQLRVEVMNGATSEDTDTKVNASSDGKKTLADWLDGKIGVIRSNGGKGGETLSEKTGSDFAKGMADKYRKGHLRHSVTPAR